MISFIPTVLLFLFFAYLIFMIKFSVEGFASHPWDNHLSSRIVGKTWKYDGPTTRVEYDFVEHKPLSDTTTQHVKLAPITHNSFPDGIRCKMM